MNIQEEISVQIYSLTFVKNHSWLVTGSILV